ncbi:zinc finger, PHD-type containing protein [Tanacetum coccineum]
MFEHEHPLSLIDLWSKNEPNDEETDEDDDDDDDMDFTKQDFRSQCSLCAKEINWFHRYYSHLDCATARHEPFMSILISPGMGKLLKNFKDDDYPHLVHLPFPDQTMNLIKHLFSKEIESGRSETNEARQTHISHQHPLILVDTTEPTTSTLSCHNPMKKVELICNGCLRPIMDSPFYTCADEDEHHCNFALNAWCTRLPSEIKDYPGHPQHTLFFLPKVPYMPFGVFECDVCKIGCNGFVYRCVKCEYNVDVCCAFIPDNITHKAHPDHLLTRVTKRFLKDAIGGLRDGKMGGKVHGSVLKCGDVSDCYVMLDTVGAEMQVVNKSEKAISLQQDDNVILTQEAISQVLPINFDGLAKAVKKGDTIFVESLSSTLVFIPFLAIFFLLFRFFVTSSSFDSSSLSFFKSFLESLLKALHQILFKLAVVASEAYGEKINLFHKLVKTLS